MNISGIIFTFLYTTVFKMLRIEPLMSYDGYDSIDDINIQQIFDSLLGISEVMHDIFAWANLFIDVKVLLMLVFVVLLLDVLQCCKRMIQFVIEFIPFF